MNGAWGCKMKRKSISVIMAILLSFGLLNVMCLILKMVTMSRTCRTIDQAVAQNGQHLLYIGLSALGMVLLGKYQKSQIEETKKQ